MAKRINVVVKEKKKDGLGIGLVAGFLGLFAVAYALGSPDVAAHFPKTMERALLNLRTEIDGVTANVWERGSSMVHAVVR
jgi:hypothetical protein